MLVASAGTGGTITGIARKLKEKCPGCKVRDPGLRGQGRGGEEREVSGLAGYTEEPNNPVSWGWESVWVPPGTTKKL